MQQLKKGSSLARVSDHKQKDNFSPSAQHESNTVLSRAQGVDICKYFTEQASGGSQRKSVELAYEWHRKQYNAKTGTNQVPYLVVNDWKRWFRESSLSGYWIIMFRRIGVEVNSATKWVNYADKTDILMHSIDQGLSHVRRIEISEETMRAQHQARKLGCVIGRTPRGLVYYPKKGQALSWLEMHPETGQAYSKAFALVASGVPKLTVYHQLGGRDVFGARSTFYDSLSNPYYAGKQYVEARLPGQLSQWVDLRYQGPPPTDWLTFQRVQGIEASYETHKNTSLDDFPAKLVLRCQCGASATNETVTKYNGSTFGYYRLNCKCGGKQIRYTQNVVNDFAGRLAQQVGLSPDAYEYALQAAEDRVRTIRGSVSKGIELLSKELTQAQALKSGALRLYVGGKINESEYAALSGDVERIEAEISRQSYYRDNQAELITEAVRFLGNIGAVYSGLPGSDQALILKMIFPDGFCLDTRKPSAPIVFCRTSRINSIFDLMSTETTLYESVKIETGLFNTNNPALGDIPEQIRTNDIGLFEQVSYLIKSA